MEGKLLVTAAKEEKWEEVAKLIDDKYDDLDEADETEWPVGETTLFKAAGAGKLDIVTSLIAAKVDVNKHDSRNSTALMRAVEGGHTELVEALVAAGAELEVQDESSLRLSIGKSGEIPNMLIAAKANLDFQGGGGQTALHLSRCDGDLVKALLLAGASPNIQDNAGKTPLIFALMNPTFDGQDTRKVALALASSGGDVNLTEKNNRTALAFAAKLGYTEVVTALIASNALLDIQTTGAEDFVVEVQEKNWTPLAYAALENRVDTLKVLIDSKADVNTLNKDGLPAAMLAAIYKEHSQIVKELIVAKAKVGVTSEDGRSPLGECHKSDSDTLSLLEAALADES